MKNSFLSTQMEIMRKAAEKYMINQTKRGKGYRLKPQTASQILMGMYYLFLVRGIACDDVNMLPTNEEIEKIVEIWSDGIIRNQ